MCLLLFLLSLFCWHSPNGALSTCDGAPVMNFQASHAIPLMRLLCVYDHTSIMNDMKVYFQIISLSKLCFMKKKQLRSSMGIRERKSRVGVVFWCLRGGTFATQCRFHGRPTTSRWPRLCVDIFRCNRKNSFRCSSNDFYGLHSSCLFFPPSHTTFYFVFGCFSLLWTTKYIGSCLPANINFSTLAAVSSSNSI